MAIPTSPFYSYPNYGYPQGQQMLPQQVNDPYASYQMRLAQMERQQGIQSTPQISQVAPQIVALKGLPVNDEQSARSAQIDFDGSIHIFPDLNNGYIYTKQLNLNDCTPIFKRYQLVEDVKEEPIKDETFVTRNEFNQLYTIVNQIVGAMTGGTQNANESASNGTNVITAKSANESTVDTSTANDKRKNTRTAKADGE